MEVCKFTSVKRVPPWLVEVVVDKQHTNNITRTVNIFSIRFVHTYAFTLCWINNDHCQWKVTARGHSGTCWWNQCIAVEAYYAIGGRSQVSMYRVKRDLQVQGQWNIAKYCVFGVIWYWSGVSNLTSKRQQKGTCYCVEDWISIFR